MKDIKDLFNEHSKYLKKRLRKTQGAGKSSHLHGYNKITIRPKTIYRFYAVSIKIPMTFFTEIEKFILKFIWKHKTHLVIKATLITKINV